MEKLPCSIHCLPRIPLCICAFLQQLVCDINPNMLKIDLIIMISASVCFGIWISIESFSLLHLWSNILLGFCIPSLSSYLISDSHLWTGNLSLSRTSVASILNLSNCSWQYPVVIYLST